MLREQAECQREKQCSQKRGTTGRAAEESVSSHRQNTIAKCHEDIFARQPFQAKMFQETKESSLSYTPWNGQGQAGGSSCSEHSPPSVMAAGPNPVHTEKQPSE